MNNKKVAGIALVITIITFSSKLLGLLRDILLANYYGTSVSSDAYVMAQSILSVFTILLVNALGTAFIPMLSDYKVNRSEKENKGLINNVYTISFLITTVISVVLLLFIKPVVGFFAPGFSAEAQQLTQMVTMVMVPTISLSVIVLLNNSFLQTRGSYFVPALYGFPSNLALITGMIFFTSQFGIVGLGVAFTVGAVCQILFQLPALIKNGFKFKPEADFNNEGLRTLLILVIPTAIGTGIQQINSIVDRMIGSGLAEGSIAALNFSNKLGMFIMGLLFASISSVFYTAMANHSANKNVDEFKNLLKGTVNTLTLLIIPASVGFAVLRLPIVKLVFERGAFDSGASEMTAVALMFTALGLLGFSLRDVFSRAFYALQDTKTPMINGSIAVVVNIVLDLVLAGPLKVGGLALATSISGLTASMLLFIALYKRIGDFGIKEIAVTFGKIVASALLMGIFVHFTYLWLNSHVGSLVVSLGGSILVGVAVYGIAVTLLGIKEVHSLLALITKKLKRG